jgi:hypothetical protein
LLQLIATFVQAIMPKPSLAELRQAKKKLRRHLHEPSRRRRNTKEWPAYFSAYGAMTGVRFLFRVTLRRPKFITSRSRST